MYAYYVCVYTYMYIHAPSKGYLGFIKRLHKTCPFEGLNEYVGLFKGYVKLYRTLYRAI